MGRAGRRRRRPHVNYLFFGLLKGPGVAEPFRSLFTRFFDVYLEQTADRELFEVLPPFYLFRALVIAHPVWYPEIPDRARVALLRFARAMGAPQPFRVEALDLLLGDAR